MNPLKIEPRSYQKSIFETAKEKNTLVVLPTGVGKTLIALMLSIERITKYPRSKILILAPTKPLIEQHYETFKKELPELYLDLQLFTGSVSADKRQKIWQTAEIIFSTPQCIANDLQNYLYNLKDVSLLVIDEAHRCLKNYDYTKVANAYKAQSEMQRILGLTASPGSDHDNIKQICKNLNIQELELRTRDSEDVRPYLQELEFEKIKVDFPPEFLEIKNLLRKAYEDKINQLKSRNLLFGPANKVTLLRLQKNLFKQIQQKNFNAMYGVSLCAQAIKISHAIELLETQTLSGLDLYLKQIIKDSETKKSKAAVNIAKSFEFNRALTLLTHLIAEKREHPKIEKIEEIVKNEFEINNKAKIIIFTQFRETSTKITKILNNDKIKARVFMGQAKKEDISGAVSGLSQKEQKQIIEEFREGKVNVLCATSIGEEGLDIPEVSTVIFYESVPSAIRKIQRTGRTARLKPGKLIMLITENTRDEFYHYASRSKEKSMHKIVENIKKDLKTKTLDDFNV